MAKLPLQSANDSPVPHPPQLPRTIAKQKQAKGNSLGGLLRDYGQTHEAWGGHVEQSAVSADRCRTALRLWSEFIAAAVRLCDRLQWMAGVLEGEKTETSQVLRRANWIWGWGNRVSLWLNSDPVPSVDAWMCFQPDSEEDKALAEVGRLSEASYNTVWAQLKDCRAAFSEFCAAWEQLKAHGSASPDELPYGELTEQPKNSAAEIGADVAEKDESPPKGKIKRTIRFEDSETPVPERFKLLGKPCGPFVGNLTHISLAVGRGKPGRAEVLKERCEDENPVIWITESGERETVLHAYFTGEKFKAIARLHPEQFSDEVKKNHPDIFRPRTY